MGLSSRRKVPDQPEDRERWQKCDQALDIALEDTFPASDPPAMVMASPPEDEEQADESARKPRRSIIF
jgi:hypothetical protein